MRIARPSGPSVFRPSSRLAGLAALVLATALSACSPAVEKGKINDPFEANNRAAHRFNVSLDKTVLKPLSSAYGGVLPMPVRDGVGHFAANLNEPSNVVNNLLQAKLDKSVASLFRFAINTTVGVGGLFDPATAMGLPSAKTDFGATMHAWGAPEGAYLELPLLGPSTERDFAGTIVDMAMNPLNFALNGTEQDVALGAKIASRVGDRYRFSDTVDSILYDSADGYAQARLLYLQNRHYELGIAAPDAYFDPYEDPYAQ